MMHRDRPCNNKACCGCGVCRDICPEKAIKLMENNEGFLNPSIDESMCINCGLCESVCPIINPSSKTNKDQYVQQYYAVRTKNQDVLRESTSGGVFTVLSEQVIKDGGVVSGVVFDDNLIPKYELLNKKEEIYRFHGAKYVQADNNDLIEKIKVELKKKRCVLASGTPCMIAAINNFFKAYKEKESLITVDIVCHGVPSAGVWSAFLEYIEQKIEIVKMVRFRYKKLGWHGHNMHIEFTNGKVIDNDKLGNSYCGLYFSNLITRPSCYVCKFANMDRVSDITIGDFWGIEKIHPELDDELGVSLVIINTYKGKKMFDKIIGDIYAIECNHDDCLQQNLQKPTSTPPGRECFWKDYTDKGIKYCLIKYTDYGLFYRIRNKCLIQVKKFFKSILE